MKDKRNCNNNMNYPMYGPMMVPPMGLPNYQGMPNFNQGITTNTFEQQINLLDQRVTRLEKINNNNNYNNKYNDSNYYMV